MLLGLKAPSSKPPCASPLARWGVAASWTHRVSAGVTGGGPGGSSQFAQPGLAAAPLSTTGLQAAEQRCQQSCCWRWRPPGRLRDPASPVAMGGLWLPPLSRCQDCPTVGVGRSDNVTGTRTTGTSCPIYQVAALLFLGRVVWISAVALCAVKFSFPSLRQILEWNLASISSRFHLCQLSVTCLFTSQCFRSLLCVLWTRSALVYFLVCRVTDSRI